MVPFLCSWSKAPNLSSSSWRFDSFKLHLQVEPRSASPCITPLCTQVHGAFQDVSVVVSFFFFFNVIL